jgi:hypothetical protein
MEQRRIYGIVSLNGENFDVWAIRTEALLESEGLSHTIREQGEEGPVATTDQIRKARGLLIQTIDDQYLAYVKECTGAREVWTVLEQAFRSKSQGRQLQLRQDIGNIRMERGENVDAYYARTKAMWNKLTSSGYTMNEKEVVWSFLSGLSIEFATIALILRSGNKNLLFSDVVNELLDFERTVTRELPEGQVSAYKAHVKVGEGFACFFCKQEGHMKRDCPKYKDWKERKERREYRKELVL